MAVAVIVKWIHLAGAALLVGGLFFLRVVLLKYAAREGGLDDKLKQTVVTRWMHTAWGLLLVMLLSGGYNMMLKLDAWKGAEGGASPHMIFGLKFLVFLAVGGVLLASGRARPERRPSLLTVNVVLGFLILLLSAWLALSY